MEIRLVFFKDRPSQWSDQGFCSFHLFSMTKALRPLRYCANFKVTLGYISKKSYINPN